jgi:hypothetical protein
MTSEAGGIVPEELRERLAEWMVLRIPCMGPVDVCRSKRLQYADDILGEIEAAGYVLVPKEQIEKLWRAAVEQEERERGEG